MPKRVPKPLSKVPRWERPEVEKEFVPSPMPNLDAGGSETNVQEDEN